MEIGGRQALIVDHASGSAEPHSHPLHPVTSEHKTVIESGGRKWHHCCTIWRCGAVQYEHGLTGLNLRTKVARSLRSVARGKIMKTRPAQDPFGSAIHMVPLGETLPLGARLRDYAVIDVLGHGGFGVVYLALDVHLNREVAIKEYLPQGLALRLSNGHVGVIPGANLARYQSGMEAFLNEAKLSARFDHPALPRVHAYWEEKGTAYIAMPHYPGTKLAQVLQAAQQPPEEVWLRALFSPLLGALRSLHAQHCYHRDISPENILVMPDGSPMLLDFGAATQLAGGKTLPLGAMLNSSYAPIEQYSQTPELPQGPWTDLYALAGVMRFAITGLPPTPATVRAVNDQQSTLAVAVQERSGESSTPSYSPSFLSAIDSALAVHPEDRPQSAQEFQNAWDAALPNTAPKANPPGVGVQTPTELREPALDRHVAKEAPFSSWARDTRTESGWASAESKPWTWAWLLAALLLLAVAAAVWWVQSQPLQKRTVRVEAASTPTITPARPDAAPSRADTAVSPTQPTTVLPSQVQGTLTIPNKQSEIAPIGAPPPAEDSSKTAASTSASPTSATAAPLPPSPQLDNKPTKSAKTRETDTNALNRSTKNMDASPRAMCGARSNFSLLYCMEKQCAQSKFSRHPQCLELKANGELR
jgi:serine/threonine protein kinase